MNGEQSARVTYGEQAESDSKADDRNNSKGVELSYPVESVHELGTIALRSADKFDDVRSIRSAIDSVSGSTSHIGLDLTELTGLVSGSTIGRLGPIVANLLLKDELQTRPFRVSPPRAGASTSQLARSGLYFAMARHDAGLDVNSDNPNDFSDKLNKWKHNWRSAAPRDALFSIDDVIDDVEPEHFENNVVAFINPSLTPVDVASRQNAIYPWLREITQGTLKYSSLERRNMLRDISIITTEFLDNVRNHANSSKSVMILSRIAGHQPCLQIAVIDNGRGVAESLRARGELMDSVDYLQRLVTNTHDLRTMGRGDGLAKIARRTRDCKGSLLIASGPELNSNNSVVVDYDFASASDGDIRIDDLGLQGTVAVVRMPLDATRYRNIAPFK